MDRQTFVDELAKMPYEQRRAAMRAWRLATAGDAAAQFGVSKSVWIGGDEWDQGALALCPQKKKATRKDGDK